MTDMHREAFERETKFATYARDGRYPDYYGNPVVQGAWEGWKAAMRYRDEQEKGDGNE